MQELVKYKKSTRVLHWIHSGSFVVLFLTGLILFLPPLAALAEDSWSRVIHRVAAVVFIVAPLIYIPMSWKGTWQGVKKAFMWGAEDIAWLKAAPRYYFLGDESVMPAQGEMNSGQKMWWLIAIVFSVLFVITGIIMWAAKASAAPVLLQWMVLLHDISFIVAGAMLLVHVYLGVLHPMMKGAWGSMANGKVTADYAKSHHAKWYEEVTASAGEKPVD